MNVLVSDISRDYQGWILVRSLQDVLSLEGGVDYLVLNTSTELSNDKIRLLSDIHKKMVSCKIIYLRDESKADNAVKMFVTGGLKGKYVSDEFFLESAQELNNLITDLSVIVKSSEFSNIGVLSDFFDRYLTDGNDKSKGISKGYLKIVKNAAIQVSDAYHAKSMELVKMAESASEIFSSSLDLVEELREKQAALQDDLEELRSKKVEMDSFSSRPVASFSVIFFPRVSYLKDKTIIRVKDIDRCKYLISYMMGFREYLEKVKCVRPKLVIIDGANALSTEKYSNYNWVTSANKTDARHYWDSIVFTNCPTVDVINKLLDDTDYDTFIVVDRTTNYKDHLLNSRERKGNKPLYAVSGSTSIEKLKLPVVSCITSGIELDKAYLCIPMFEDYPKDPSRRVDMYLKRCTVSYNLLATNL